MPALSTRIWPNFELFATAIVFPAEAALGDGLLVEGDDVVPPHAAASNVPATAPTTRSLHFMQWDNDPGY